jgi:hypothetical protein
VTTQAEAREAIYEHFAAGWTAASRSERYCLENESFVPTPGTAWLRLAVRNVSGAQDSLGGVGERNFERIGIIFAQVFVPLNTGRSAADNVVQALRDILEGVRLSGTDLWTYESVAREAGPTDGWDMTVLETNFRYVEHR